MKKCNLLAMAKFQPNIERGEIERKKGEVFEPITVFLCYYYNKNFTTKLINLT